MLRNWVRCLKYVQFHFHLQERMIIEYGYKLGAILSFMQKHALMIAEDPSLTGRKYLKYYNKYVPEVMNKTILVKQEDLAPAINTIEKIKAIYSQQNRDSYMKRIL